MIKKLMRWEIFLFGEDDFFCPSTLKPLFSLLELELHLTWAKLPEMGIQAGKSGSCCPQLCVCSPFWICSKVFRASFSSALSDQREVILSDILCFITQVLFCLYGFYPYPSFMEDYLCSMLVLERLCCSMFTDCGHCTCL